MRKIDKTRILSTEYKKWVDELNCKEEKHPSESKRFKKDVMMNLLHCQKGVCAYTEMFLCDFNLITEDNWENGRYRLRKPQRFGELEHFDPKLKKNKFWEWENLFVVHADINRLKGVQEVDDILKPDSPVYDPMVLLKYDIDFHVFYPHPSIKNKTIRERIRRMIKILQINYGPVRSKRRKFLKMVFELREFAQTVEVGCFFTAYQMAAAARKEEA
jgi:hypothetical protein